MAVQNYLTYLFNPLELLRTKKVLQVNQPVVAPRKEPEEISIFVFDYNSSKLEFKKLENVTESFPYADTPAVTWVNVDGLRQDDIEKIGTRFGIHNLIIEDILSFGQRAKTDEINGLLFCLLNMMYFNEKDASVEVEQISIVLGKNFVISFQEDASRDVFNPLRERLKVNHTKIRQNGADFLFYSLIDMIVDNYFVVMEKLGEKIEELEEDIVRQSSKRSLAKINILRKEMIILKRSVAPVRELVNGILRSESELIEDKTVKYFKDVYDHILQANDLAENYRDMMLNLHDLYISNVNLKMNEVMKVMAVVTCLLAPATVIGGIFGMNFDVIPFAHNTTGFYFIVGIMVFVPVIMLFIFKRRGWF